MRVAAALNSLVFPNPNPNPNPNSLKPCRQFHLKPCTLPQRITATKGIAPLSRRILIAPFSASHQDSHSEREVEKEKDDVDLEGEDPQEAWKRALDSFKEQALKMQSISQVAYEVYSKKALVKLQETSEQLKIQAGKARDDLSVIAKEIAEDGVEYLSEAAEKSPEPVKEVVETFTSSTDDLNDISKVHEFYFGIPYGLILSVGGFLSFMLTGSISAIRFGVILGGALFALAISSLRSYRRGKSDTLALKGQVVIVGIIFLRELRLLSQGSTFMSFLNTFISGAMVAFYLYRIMLNKKASKDSNIEPGTEN